MIVNVKNLASYSSSFENQLFRKFYRAQKTPFIYFTVGVSIVFISTDPLRKHHVDVMSHIFKILKIKLIYEENFKRLTGNI